MAQGVEIVDYVAEALGERSGENGLLDVLIVGAGAAGLNAALRAQEKGLRYVLLEKEKIANTIENFPEGKWVYAEPDATPAKGKLWLDGARKEDLIARWHQIVRDNDLDVRSEEPLATLEKQGDGTFLATTERGTYRARRVVLATGQRGNPRKLGVPGEEREEVYHALYSPRKYSGERMLVVGGGNSAVEAALTLSGRNRVVLSYRGGELTRLFKENARLLDEAVAAGRIELVLNSNVKRFEAGKAVLEVDSGGHQQEQTVEIDHAFVLIGADLPVKFLKSLGIRLENEWDGTTLWSTLLTAALFAGLWLFGPALGGAAPFERDPGSAGTTAGGLAALLATAGLIARGVRGDRWSWLGLSFFVWYSIYGIKVGAGEEFWPNKGWGYERPVLLRAALGLLVHGALHRADDRLRPPGAQALGPRPARPFPDLDGHRRLDLRRRPHRRDAGEGHLRPLQDRRLGDLRLSAAGRRLAGRHPAGHRLPLHGRQGLVPLLVPPGQDDAVHFEDLDSHRAVALPHRRQRQVHRLQRVFAQLPGRHRRHAVRLEAGDPRQRHLLLHRLWRLRHRLPDGHPVVQFYLVTRRG